MPESVIEIVRLLVGRGLRAEPYGLTDEKVELSVNLNDLGEELETAVEAAGGGSTFDPATATTWWMPLVDSDGTCVLDADGDLIPTLIPL